MDPKEFYKSALDGAGLSLPFITSAIDQHYGDDFIPIVKRPSECFREEEERFSSSLYNLSSLGEV